MACLSDIDLATLHRTRLEERISYKLSWLRTRGISTTKTRATNSFDCQLNNNNDHKLATNNRVTSTTTTTSSSLSSSSVSSSSCGGCVVVDTNRQPPSLNFDRNGNYGIGSLIDDDSYFTSTTTRRRRSGTWP